MPKLNQLLCLLFASAGLGACSPEQEADPFAGRRATDIDLLVRAPDFRADHPGDITPLIARDAEGRAVQMTWGEQHGIGWSGFHPDFDWGSEGEHAFIENNQPCALLFLPAPISENRKLELTLWLDPTTHADAEPLQIKLNGRSVASLELTRQAKLYSIDAPAELWREGRNRLELIATEHTGEAAASLAWDTFRLARVSYGAPRRVDWSLEETRLSLAPGTGATYYIESSSASYLVLRGKSLGRGELVISSGLLSPQTGDRLLPDLTQNYKLDGAFEKPLRLPMRPGGLAFLQLLWKAEGSAALELDDLFLVEDDPQERPPILFVSIDTLAARHMSVYGYGRKTTPNLSAFAKQAVVFERCAANAPWTLPSYLSVMTGLYPSSHLARVRQGAGVTLDNQDYWQVALSRWTLAESLRARGYQTAAAVDTEWLAPTWRIDQGFDLYDTSAFGPFDNPELGIKLILRNYVTYLDQLRDPKAPSFTFIHALDAHGPYWPEAPYADAFRDALPTQSNPTPAGCMPQSYGAIPTWMAQTLTPLEQRAKAGDWAIPEQLPLERIVQMYDESILKVDDQLGRMFDLLRERGLYEKSVIVISGDHGESFKHDFYSHGCMWEDIVHVPLLIKLPGGKFGGTRIDQSVQLVDLYPTLLDLAGIAPGRDYLHGRSLLPLMRGESQASRPTFSEGGHVIQFMLEQDGLKLIETWPGKNAIDPALLTHPRIPKAWREKNFPGLVQAGQLTPAVNAKLRADEGFAAKAAELKRLIQGPYYELYDLNRDPGELEDLYAKRPEDVARLLKLLAVEKRKGELAKDDASADPQIPLSAAAVENLDALGYTEETK